jgi:hypothetical protein
MEEGDEPDSGGRTLDEVLAGVRATTALGVVGLVMVAIGSVGP